jgi:hypothetical protein
VVAVSLKNTRYFRVEVSTPNGVKLPDNFKSVERTDSLGRKIFASNWTTNIHVASKEASRLMGYFRTHKIKAVYFQEIRAHYFEGELETEIKQDL